MTRHKSKRERHAIVELGDESCLAASTVATELVTRGQGSKSVSARLVNSILVPLLAIGNHDFCPWANRYVYWLKQPIGWFSVGAAAAALTAVFLEPRVWVIFGSLVAVMTLGVVWPWLAMRGATAEIGFDRRRCREGDRVQVSLSIHNRWPCPLWGLAIENGFFLEVTEGETRPVAALARAAAWSRSEFLFEFRPGARGVYPHSAPELVTGFPFGIWRASKRISVSRELVAWPKTTPLTSIPSLGGDIADVIGMLFDRPGNEGDMIGVRPFRDGDRLRSIHWAQTARRDSLIVTERQAAARRWIVIAVDIPAFWDTSSSAVGMRRRQLEMAIRVSASIARELHAHHADVRFVIGSTDLCLSPDPSGLHHLLDALARFQIQPEAFRPPCGFGRKSLAIVVTTDQRRSEWERASGLRGSLRLVLIDGANPVRAVDRNAWINIESDGDCSHQLRHQWERVCHVSAAK